MTGTAVPRPGLALLELFARGFRGRLVRRLRQLRQPRYLIATLAGAAYFFWFLPWRMLLLRGSRRSLPGGAMEHLPQLLPFVVGLGVAVALTLMWLLASSKPALRLNEAEIHFLLPAPITRRRVLAYALLKQQAGALTGALVLAVLRGIGPPGQRLGRLVTTWALLTLFDLHLKGVNLWKARLRELPPAAARLRVAAALGTGVLFWAAAGWYLWRAVATLSFAGAPESFLQRAAEAIQAGPLPLLLAPFVWFSGPLVGRAGPWDLLLVVVIVAAHYEWVLRSRAHFEEAAVESARRQLQRGKRRSRFESLSARSRQAEPFALVSAGVPEAAIYWKNLMLQDRSPLRRRLRLVVLVGLLVSAALAACSTAAAAFSQGLAAATGSIGIFLLLFFPAMSGLLFRGDLRVDLREIETLAPWPLPGWRLVAAELLAPATTSAFLSLTGVALLLAAVGGARGATLRLMPGVLDSAASTASRLLHALVAAGSAWLLGLAVSLLSISLQNLATLIVPGWIGLGLERRAGATFTGQRILVFLGHILTLLAALLPAGFLLGLLILVQVLAHLPFTVYELPLLSAAGCLVVLAETWLICRAAGERWERFDPSLELLDRAET